MTTEPVQRPRANTTRVPRASVQMTMPEGKPPAPLTGMLRLPDGTIKDILTIEDVRSAAGNTDAIFWVDLDVSRQEEAQLLTDVFHFHPLAIEDALNPASRV